MSSTSSDDPCFGSRIRRLREAKASPDFSLRQVALRAGIEPSYLSKIERDQQPPPGEATIRRLAQVLEEDPDVLLAAAGKVSSELQAIVRKRPALMAELLRSVKNSSNKQVNTLIKQIRDGEW